MKRTKLHESYYASSLIEASLDPLIAISMDGKITDMNQAKVKITGIERETLFGTNFLIISLNRKKRLNFIRKCLQKDLLPISRLRFVIKTEALQMFYLMVRFIKMKREMCLEQLLWQEILPSINGQQNCEMPTKNLLFKMKRKKKGQHELNSCQ